jgi:transposase
MPPGEIIREKEQEIALLRAENAQLREELAWIKKQLFGQKRERFEGEHPDQLRLDLGPTTPSVEVPEPEEQEIRYTRKKKVKHPGRHPLPAHLERVEMIIEPEEDTTGLVCIGEEITEVLAKIPSRNYVIRYRRKKYAKADGSGMLIGRLPSRAIEKGIPHESVLADMLVSKYVDHQPLYRQAQILKREGIDIPTSTFSDWAEASARLLEPLYEVLARVVTTRAQYLQVDESPMQVLDKPKAGQKNGKAGKSHRGYQWLYLDVDANLVLFDYQKGRGREGPVKMLKDFKGYIQTDGYGVYDQFDQHPDITLLGCMAHARRYFVKAQSNDPKRANYFLDQVQKLYQIERTLQEEQADPQRIRTVRREQAIPILQHLADWFVQEYPKVLPKSAIGKAIAYCHARWEKICRYTLDGNFRIDNNLIENRIRPLALGRKNWLFAGSHHAAKNTAIFYSIIGSAILNGHNPFKYLFTILTHLPTYPVNQLDELLPHRLSFEPPEVSQS